MSFSAQVATSNRQHRRNRRLYRGLYSHTSNASSGTLASMLALDKAYIEALKGVCYFCLTI